MSDIAKQRRKGSSKVCEHAAGFMGKEIRTEFRWELGRKKEKALQMCL